MRAATHQQARRGLFVRAATHQEVEEWHFDDEFDGGQGSGWAVALGCPRFAGRAVVVLVGPDPEFALQVAALTPAGLGVVALGRLRLEGAAFGSQILQGSGLKVFVGEEQGGVSSHGDGSQRKNGQWKEGIHSIFCGYAVLDAKSLPRFSVPRRLRVSSRTAARITKPSTTFCM